MVVHRYTYGINMGYADSMVKEYNRYITHYKYTTNKEIIEYRLKIIKFYDKYGLEATREAFNISRATIFNWKKRIKEHNGSLNALAKNSTIPKNFRKSKVDAWYREQILIIRNKYERLGKSKTKVLLDELCLKEHRRTISESTIGRIIHDLRESGQLINYKRVHLDARTGRIHVNKYNPRLKKRRRGEYIPKEPGDLVQIDCVIKFYNGIRRYIVSGIDYKSSFAYSYAYTKLSSAISTDFLHKFQQVAPFTIKHIQTDNGSEFMDRFHADLEKQGLTHFFNYPRHPKSNGKIERYNRTIQLECVDPNIEELAYDIDQFNQTLTDWLLYYNTKRPHFAHREPENKNIQIPPMRAFIYMLKLNQQQSNMLWTQTKS